MKYFLISYKLIALIGLAFIAVPTMFLYSFSGGSAKEISPNTKQKAYRKKWLQQVVCVIGLKVEVKGEVPPDSQSALWVSNHISWMDIALIGSQGVGFLSKKEVRKWPIIGWLGAQGGTVFIDRGAKNASQVAANSIAEKIKAGDNILVFPEATTTSGLEVKRFHARIFAPALDHQLIIQPIAIQYLDEQDQPHSKVSWSTQSFMTNMMGVLAEPSIRVILTFLPAINSQQHTGRRALAEICENQIKDIVLYTSAIKIA